MTISKYGLQLFVCLFFVRRTRNSFGIIAVAFCEWPIVLDTKMMIYAVLLKKPILSTHVSFGHNIFPLLKARWIGLSMSRTQLIKIVHHLGCIFSQALPLSLSHFLSRMYRARASRNIVEHQSAGDEAER